MSVKLYVEGGGNSKQLRIQCREGFHKLIGKAGFAGRMPRIIACGPREEAYSAFRTAATLPGVAILLVDSEDTVAASTAWDHLQLRDGWRRPPGTDADQAQLMATCMETWLMADRAALRTFFGSNLQESALFPIGGLEARTRQDVQDRLEHATRNCGRDRSYAKGERSFRLLSQVDPQQLGGLMHFQRFIDGLNRYL